MDLLSTAPESTRCWFFDVHCHDAQLPLTWTSLRKVHCIFWYAIESKETSPSSGPYLCRLRGFIRFKHAADFNRVLSIQDGQWHRSLLCNAVYDRIMRMPSLYDGPWVFGNAHTVRTDKRIKNAGASRFELWFTDPGQLPPNDVPYVPYKRRKIIHKQEAAKDASNDD